MDGATESSSVSDASKGEGKEKEKLRIERRFLEMKDAGELRLAEVQDLLEEYQRLVVELRKRGLV